MAWTCFQPWQGDCYRYCNHGVKRAAARQRTILAEPLDKQRASCKLTGAALACELTASLHASLASLAYCWCHPPCLCPSFVPSILCVTTTLSPQDGWVPVCTGHCDSHTRGYYKKGVQEWIWAFSENAPTWVFVIHGDPKYMDADQVGQVPAAVVKADQL